MEILNQKEKEIIRQAENIIRDKLLGVRDLNLRCSGRTTRIIDDAIQRLFRYGYTEVVDHYQGSNQVAILNNIKRTILHRLESEHNIDSKHVITKINQYKSFNPFNYNIKCLEIKLCHEIYDKIMKRRCYR